MPIGDHPLDAEGYAGGHMMCYLASDVPAIKHGCVRKLRVIHNRSQKLLMAGICQLKGGIQRATRRKGQGRLTKRRSRLPRQEFRAQVG